MKAKWIDEVAAIVQSEAFGAWRARLSDAKRELVRATERHKELLTQVNLLEFRAELLHKSAIDTLEESNELEDAAERAASDLARYDNTSFDLVSRFEEQRKRCTELWEKLGALDVAIDEQAAHGSLGTNTRLHRERERLAHEYDREEDKKNKLWEQYEDLGVRIVGAGLVRAEKAKRAKLVRGDAERAFATYELETQKAAELKREAQQTAATRDDAEKALRALFDEAEQAFDCIRGDDFLYWPARDPSAPEGKKVWTVSLVDDAGRYAVPLVAGKLYACDARGGVESLVAVESTTRPPAPAHAAGHAAKAKEPA